MTPRGTSRKGLSRRRDRAPTRQRSVAAFPQYADPTDPGRPETLKPVAGAMFELHPNFFVKVLGGAALGDMVHVGASGSRRLLETPLDLMVWG